MEYIMDEAAQNVLPPLDLMLNTSFHRNAAQLHNISYSATFVEQYNPDDSDLANTVAFQPSLLLSVSPLDAEPSRSERTGSGKNAQVFEGEVNIQIGARLVVMFKATTTLKRFLTAIFL